MTSENGMSLRSGIIPAVLIVAAGLAAYWNSFGGAFVFDDSMAYEALDSGRLWPTWQEMTGPRPVVALSFHINSALGGRDAWGCHALNVAIHLLAALTLYGIMRRTLQIAECRVQSAECRFNAPQLSTPFVLQSAILGLSEVEGCNPWPERSRRLQSAIALATALIWLVHPLQTEAVTYIIQRGESLMGLFYLLTLYCSIRSFSSSRPWPWRVAAAVACAIGMGCKPVMVSAPIIVFLYELVFHPGRECRLRISECRTQKEDERRLPRSSALCNPWPERSRRPQSAICILRRSWPLYACLAATWLILAALLAKNPLGETVGFDIPELTPWRYARSEFGVILHYLRLSFWPHPLVLDYAWRVARTPAQIVPPAIVIAALLAATLWALRRRLGWAFPGIWFFFILAPTSSIVPIADLCFEHRMYLSLAGVAALAVVAAHAAGRHLLGQLSLSEERRARLGRAAGTVLTLLVVGALGWRTHLRNEDYRSEPTMWSQVLRYRPFNARAHINIGRLLRERGQEYDDEALAHYREAARLEPKNAEVQYNIGNVLLDKGNFKEAAERFYKAVEIKPTHAKAQNNLGVTLGQLGQLDEALVHLREALRLDPGYARAYENIGNVLHLKGRTAEALQFYEKALQLQPGTAKSYFNVANMLLSLGRRLEALARYENALALAESSGDRNLARMVRNQIEYCRTGRRPIPGIEQ